MKKAFIVMLIAALQAVPAMAQFTPVRTGSPEYPYPRPGASAGTTTFLAGSAAAIGGLALSAAAAVQEHPAFTAAAGGTLLAAGVSAMFVGFSSVLFTDIPECRVRYCEAWASPEQTRDYRTCVTVAKAAGAAGLTLFAAGAAAGVAPRYVNRLSGLEKAATPLWVSGLSLTAASVVTLIVADSHYYIQARDGWEATRPHRRPVSYLEFGATAGGAGLSLNF